jgi:hypothetical protein
LSSINLKKFINKFKKKTNFPAQGLDYWVDYWGVPVMRLPLVMKVVAISNSMTQLVMFDSLFFNIGAGVHQTS